MIKELDKFPHILRQMVDNAEEKLKYHLQVISATVKAYNDPKTKDGLYWAAMLQKKTTEFISVKRLIKRMKAPKDKKEEDINWETRSPFTRKIGFVLRRRVLE